MSNENSREVVRVLFVDDEENIIRSLRRLFMDENFEALTALGGERGLEIVNNTKNIGLIVSDQRMPGITGVEFLEKARKIAPDAFRIVLTGYADVQAAMGAINRGGVFRYITKPWDDDELIRVVKETVGLYSMKLENARMQAVIKQQNQQLEEWNSQLESKVQEQTTDIKRKNIQLKLLNQQLQRNFDSSITAFSNLLELRDQTVRNHSNRVAEVAVLVAKQFRLAADVIEQIRLAGLLHDIGKIGISDQLLQKNPDEMSPDELEEYSQHSVRGQTAVDGIRDLRQSGVLIRHHHERYDGEGFPDRLQGEAIPVGARIIGLADYFDRELGNEPERFRLYECLKECREKAGSRFDPQLLPQYEAALKAVYFGDRPAGEIIEVEVADLNTLIPGMVVSRDVTSGTSVLLLRKGSKLTETDINSLKRYYELDPPETGVFVWMKK